MMAGSSFFEIDLTLRANEHVAVMGRSGAGKSTLLGLLYAQRRHDVALIPQASALVKPLSVFHNVYMGQLDRHSTAYNLRNLVWEQDLKSGKVDTSAVSIIWETPTYPDYHWVARGDIDTAFGRGFTDRLQAAILGIDDPKLLAIFDRSKFIPAKNDDYKVIEEVGKLSGLIN